MSATTSDWLKGLAAAFVGGGSSAFAGGTAATIIAPEKFNLSSHFGATLKLAGAIFLLSAITHVFAYLTTRPTPWSGVERRAEEKTP